MSICPPTLGRPILWGAVLAIVAHVASADTAKFYNDGLTKPWLLSEGLAPSQSQADQQIYRVADTARFYDDGLTIRRSDQDLSVPIQDTGNTQSIMGNSIGITKYIQTVIYNPIGF